MELLDSLTNVLKQHNIPIMSSRKMKELLDDVGAKIPLRVIKDYLKKNSTAQITKNVGIRQFKKHYIPIQEYELGHLQIDLADFQKVTGHNRKYRYLFVIIDVYSRYGWALPLKNKEGLSVRNAFKEWLDNLPYWKMKKVYSVQSDKGSEYQKSFTRLLEQYRIEHRLTEVGDKHKQGIIERWIRTLRERLRTYWVEKRNFNWIDHINDVVKVYNKTTHRTIKARPLEVIQGKIEPEIRHPKSVDLLEPGDKVRKLVKRKAFDKRSNTQAFSRSVYAVKERIGWRYKLDGLGKSYARWQLMRVEGEDDVRETVELVDQDRELRKERNRKYYLRREGIEDKNVRRSKRERKKVDRLTF